MSKIFITGASGLIGSHLCQYLAKQGHELVLLLRDKQRDTIPGRPLLPSDVLQVKGDLLQPESYLPTMRGCDAVIHLAADYRVGVSGKPKERQKMYMTNVQGTLTVAQAVQQAEIPRLIYASSTAAYGETWGAYPDESYVHNSIFRCYYEQTKHIAHQLLKRRQQEGLPVVMAVLGGVFGEGDTASVTQTMRDFLRDKLPVLPDSVSRFQLCHVSHVCKAFELLLSHPNPDGAYLFTGQDFSMREIIATLAELSNRPEPKRISLKALSIPAAVMDALSRFGFEFPLSKEVLQVLDGSTYMYSCAKAQKELGWSAGDPHKELKVYMQQLISENV